jgi:hypothetical protein
MDVNARDIAGYKDMDQAAKIAWLADHKKTV